MIGWRVRAVDLTPGGAALPAPFSHEVTVSCTVTKGSGPADRTLTASIGSPASLQVTVTCETAGYVAASQTVTLTAQLACSTHLGTLTAGITTHSGGLWGGNPCRSPQRFTDGGNSITRYAHRHTITVTSPGWVTIDLKSAAGNHTPLDTYLILLKGHSPDGTGTVAGRDDDTGTGTNSRLADVFLQPGDYTIEATTDKYLRTGDYDLTINATLTGLKPSYNATVDEKLTIGFESGSYLAKVQSITPPTLTWSARRTESRSSLAVTADMADTHRVVMTLTKHSSAAARNTHQSSIASATASSVQVEFDVVAGCRSGLAASARNGHLCVRSAAQTASTNYPEDRITEANRGPRYPVTLGTLWGVKRVTKEARDSYMNPSPGVRRTCGVTANRLAAIMLAVPLFEVPNIKSNTYLRYPARSPMALSRWDRDHDALYSNNNMTSGPARAFWNPGVGLWQLDDTWTAAARALSHAERAEIHIGGQLVAEYLAAELCNEPEGDIETELKDILDPPWLACVDKDKTPNEHRCYEWSYLKLWVKATDDLHVTSYSTKYPGDTLDYRSDFSTSGGLSKLKCRWGTSGNPFSCWFYDTDNEEGWMLDEDPAATRTSQSPLAAPFMSFVQGGNRFAVFPESFLGTQTTLIKAVPVGTNVRHTSASSWTPDQYRSSALQVEICQVIAVEAGSTCQWVSTTFNNGPHTFAKKLRDAGH